MAFHARGIEHHSHGVENVLSLVNLCLATGNIGRKGAGPNMITGQGNGQGGREHGQKCDQLPGQRHIGDPAAREYIAKVWGVTPDSLPHAGLTAMEIFEAIHRGEIKGLLSICFNPLVSLPDAGYIREALNKLEFFGIIDFFPRRPITRTSSLPAACRKRKRVSCVRAKGASSRSTRRSIRRATHAAMHGSSWISRIVSARASTSSSPQPARFSRNCEWRQKVDPGGLLGHHLGASGERDGPVLARAVGRPSGHASPL